MEGLHTAEHVMDVVAAVMKEWDITEHKVRVIVKDSGSNMVAAFQNRFKADQGEDEHGDEEAEDVEDVVDVETG